ncbi:hypothetical protein DEI81_05540 [Curtobacterium sp. MCBD17_013]|uniref:hypothetical protein n=1 Tax=unclassified Curtobacterium TaxID=257496 RepID=UPI000DA716D6|nr:MULTISPECIES: hypothetical protein [unclassified Curtobacterium]PZF64418.1 hypothetical protein DEI81_05540 [Curtobacterium sp. MCBD17_013]WIB62595.1 hypothetical protein DEI94_10425 [Curtobacterium sp. MCBD17_040]
MHELSVIATPSDPELGRQLRRATERGALTRLAPGRFVRTDHWDAASADVRHRARIRAVLPTTAPGNVVSHSSAVAVHGLPWLGAFPSIVTVTDPKRVNGQRRSTIRKLGGATRFITVTRWRRSLVTTPAATGVDIALAEDRRHAIVVLDALLRSGVRRPELTRELRMRPASRARRRAADLIALASGDSGSPGESVTRLLMHDLGAPMPVLQAPFHDADGLIGRVDFWFPTSGVIVEFDGAVKYRSRAMRHGRSSERVVMDEKRREDRLRSVPGVRTVLRLVWADIQPGGTAPEQLARVGLLAHVA